ncbi:hypothetical protein Holit_00462 [Hollandina sp. SP2]
MPRWNVTLRLDGMLRRASMECCVVPRWNVASRLDGMLRRASMVLVFGEMVG